MTVRNGTISEFYAGIRLGGSGNRVTGVLVTSNTSNGLEVYGSDQNLLKNNDAVGNGWSGIALIAANNVSIVGNRATGNDAAGISIQPETDRGSADNAITGNVLERNGQGIYLVSGGGAVVARTTIRRNRARYNTGSGIELNGAEQNVVAGNDASGNGVSGIVLKTGNGSIIRNRTYANGARGIYLYESNGTQVLRNLVRGNTGDGILLEISHYNTVRSNTANGNNLAGIALTQQSEGDVVDSNTANENGFHGIYLDYANNTLQANHTNHNGLLSGIDDNVGLGIAAPAGTTNSGNVAHANDNPDQCFAADLNCYHAGTG